MASSHRVIVHGGKGAVGSKCVEIFKSLEWWVINIDTAAHEEANENVIVKTSESLIEQAAQVTADVAKLLGETKVDAIVSVAEGRVVGNSSSEDLYKHTDLMLRQSVWTSIISGHLAALHLKSGGLLTLLGAKVGLSGTPGMIAYSMAKAAVHHLCKSLAAENSGMPAGAVTVAILPDIIDTPANRTAMPDADFSTWTSVDYIAEMVFTLATGENRPASGTLLQVVTAGGNTQSMPTE